MWDAKKCVTLYGYTYGVFLWNDSSSYCNDKRESFRHVVEGMLVTNIYICVCEFFFVFR